MENALVPIMITIENPNKDDKNDIVEVLYVKGNYTSESKKNIIVTPEEPNYSVELLCPNKNVGDQLLDYIKQMFPVSIPKCHLTLFNFNKIESVCGDVSILALASHPRRFKKELQMHIHDLEIADKYFIIIIHCVSDHDSKLLCDTEFLDFEGNFSIVSCRLQPTKSQMIMMYNLIQNPKLREYTGFILNNIHTQLLSNLK